MKDIPVFGIVSDNVWVTVYHVIQDIGPIITFVFLGIAALIIFIKNAKKDVA
jgi:hypothetical protein